MPIYRFIDSMHTAIATAAAAGSFTALMVTRKYAWAQALTYFVIGQATAFYFTVPISERFGLGSSAYGWIGFLLGVFGMLFWGGVLKIFLDFTEDPKGTLNWLRTLWKGGGQ